MKIYKGPHAKRNSVMESSALRNFAKPGSEEKLIEERENESEFDDTRSKNLNQDVPFDDLAKPEEGDGKLKRSDAKKPNKLADKLEEQKRFEEKVK